MPKNNNKWKMLIMTILDTFLSTQIQATLGRSGWWWPKNLQAESNNWMPKPRNFWSCLVTMFFGGIWLCFVTMFCFRVILQGHLWTKMAMAINEQMLHDVITPRKRTPPVLPHEHLAGVKAGAGAWKKSKLKIKVVSFEPTTHQVSNVNHPGQKSKRNLVG